jgi:hypothetical protein
MPEYVIGLHRCHLLRLRVFSWTLKMTFLKNSLYWIFGGLGRRLVVDCRMSLTEGLLKLEDMIECRYYVKRSDMMLTMARIFLRVFGW